MNLRIITYLLIIFSISACQIKQSIINKQERKKEEQKVSVSTISTSVSELKKTLNESEKRSIEADPWAFLATHLNIDIPNNKKISHEIDLILKGKKSFLFNLEKSEPYIYYIMDQLNRQNIPVELALVPLIESAYDPAAKSSASSVGLWQIAPVTAKAFGLTNNRQYDARRDLVKSTQTAIRLLKYLNQRFDGDWLITLAAYNAGEGRIKKAINWNKRKGLDTNYWALDLSQETFQYIPRFLAVVDIIRHNQRYDITLPKFDSNNGLVKLKLSKSMNLKTLANYADVPSNQFSTFNAAYRTKVTVNNNEIYVPKNKSQKLYDKLKNEKLVKSNIIDLLSIESKNTIGGERFNAEKVDTNHSITNRLYTNITDENLESYKKDLNHYRNITYKVKAGDSLSEIAEQYNVKLRDLLQWNNIKNNTLLKINSSLIIHLAPNTDSDQ